MVLPNAAPFAIPLTAAAPEGAEVPAVKGAAIVLLPPSAAVEPMVVAAPEGA